MNEVFLNPDNAKELEDRVLNRMLSNSDNGFIAESAVKIAVRSAIMSIQEYERMKAERDQKS